MSRSPFSIADRIASFGHALRGLGVLIRGEHNAWIHAAATLAALALAAWLEIGPGEWIAIALVIGGVWISEALNTAIESLADAVTTEPDERIRDAKDAAAGAVLVSAFLAVVVALIVFGPRLLEIFSSGRR